MEEIKLKKDQEINHINLEVADNGGCVLKYTIYTPSKSHSDSSWDDKTEIFTDEEKEDAMARIRELYEADYANKMSTYQDKMDNPGSKHSEKY